MTEAIPIPVSWAEVLPLWFRNPGSWKLVICQSSVYRKRALTPFPELEIGAKESDPLILSDHRAAIVAFLCTSV